MLRQLYQHITALGVDSREPFGRVESAPRVVYLRWGARRNRADDIAARFGAELVSLRWQTKVPWLVPIRHVTQFFQTLALLEHRRPEFIISHHTQPFCSLAAVLYCSMSDARCVTDCHNGPFQERIWQLPPIKFLNRFIFERADLNLVHNLGMLEHVERELGLGARFSVLWDVVPEPTAEPRKPDGDWSQHVMAICSWSADEPMDVVFEAARRLPDVGFHVTGRPSGTHADLMNNAPENVHLTGFLDDDDYDALLAGVDAALVLSTRDAVLTRASQETIAAGTPLVTSDTPTARDYLTGGTVFVDNEPKSIAEGIRRALANTEVLSREMQELRTQRRSLWWTQARAVAERMGLPEELIPRGPQE